MYASCTPTGHVSAVRRNERMDHASPKYVQAVARGSGSTSGLTPLYAKPLPLCRQRLADHSLQAVK